MTFKTVFRAFSSAKVQYCMLGRTAAAFYGLNVTTMDVDILLMAGRANTLRFFRALKKLGVISKLPPKQEMELFESQKVARFRIGDLMLDVIKWQEGFSREAWRRVKKARYLGVTVRIADLHDLILTKEQTPRAKDKEDVQALRELLGRRGRKK